MESLRVENDTGEKKKSANGIFNMPQAVPAILLNILFERFSTTATSGIYKYKVKKIINCLTKNLTSVAILVLYLNRKLNFNPSSSTAIFHTIEVLAYGFTIVGSIIADSWWGHYKTILRMTLVFTVGSAAVSIGAIEALNLPAVYTVFIMCVFVYSNIEIFVENLQLWDC